LTESKTEETKTRDRETNSTDRERETETEHDRDTRQSHETEETKTRDRETNSADYLSNQLLASANMDRICNSLLKRMNLKICPTFASNDSHSNDVLVVRCSIDVQQSCRFYPFYSYYRIR